MRISDWSSDVCSSDLSLACIQHPELDAGCVGHTAHETIESFDLPHQMALSQAADGGIAGHDADAVTAVRNQGGAGAEARGRGRGFTAGVPTAYHDDVETFGSGHLQPLDRKSTRLNSSH